MDFDNLLLEREGAVARVTINRPQVLNALNSSTIDDLRRAVLALKHDAAVRAIVITGSGGKAFVAGADQSRHHSRLWRHAASAATRRQGCGARDAADRAACHALFGLVASTDDMREGTKAFLKKRKPEFRGQ